MIIIHNGLKVSLSAITNGSYFISGSVVIPTLITQVCFNFALLRQQGFMNGSFHQWDAGFTFYLKCPFGALGSNSEHEIILVTVILETVQLLSLVNKDLGL